VPAAKWLINQNPEPDLQLVSYFANILKDVQTSKFVLISTIDVYGVLDHTGTATESSIPRPDNPYGEHRYMLETEVLKLFPDALIVRLPALFGEGLKKNVVYDLMNNNRTSFILPNSSFQWYDMSQLWDDIEICLKNKLKLVNLFPEPLDTMSIVKIAKNCLFDFDEPSDSAKKGAIYNVRTEFGQIFGSKVDGYIRNDSFLRMHEFMARQRIQSALGVSTIGWTFVDAKETDDILTYLNQLKIQNIEIAPTSIWGSWDEVRESLFSGKVRKFAANMADKGFKITSMQAVLYQLPDIQLFAPDGQFVEHFKFLCDLAKELSLEGQIIKIVFGAPKNRNPPSDLSEAQAFELASAKFFEIAEYATKCQAVLCIEANPPAYGCFYLETLDKARKMVETVNTPGLDFMLDTGCANLGNETLGNIDKQYVKKLGHLHLSQPQLAQFINSDDLLVTLKKIKNALCRSPVWIVEVRNTNAEDLKESLAIVKEALYKLMLVESRFE